MTNKIIHWVLAGVFLFLWYWVGYQGYYASEGAISIDYTIATILTVALMRS